MSRTLKDMPYKYRPKHAKPRHARMMRDRYCECNLGIKCCGLLSEGYNARAVEKRLWLKVVGESE